MNFTFNDMPLLIKKEKYLKDIPIYVDHAVVYTQDSSADRLSVLHQHSFIEISYVENGSGTLRIWNESYPVSDGDLYIINVAVPHGFFVQSSENPLVVRSMFFDLQDFFEDDIVKVGGERYLFGLFAQNNFVMHLLLKRKHLLFVEQKYEEIQREYKEQGADWKEMIKAHLIVLLLRLKRMSSVSQKNRETHAAEDSSQISAITYLIENHYGDPSFSLKKASQILHRSESSISRQFQGITGKRFSDYLRGYRMQQAAALVLETNLSNEEIALKCGYCDFPSFYKQFRMVMGKSPGEYRKQKEKEVLQQETLGERQCARIVKSLLLCRSTETLQLVEKALEDGVTPEVIINQGLLCGINIIGEKFQCNEMFVAEMMSAGRIMNDSMELLKPYLMETDYHPIGTAVICTVQGDMHDVGKNLVKLMLEASGIACIDLGVDVSADRIVKAIQENNVQLLCLSCLLTTTMNALKDVINAVCEAGLRERVHIMVGGAPVSQSFADSIGADCYTKDAVSAAAEARRIILTMNQ